MTGTEAMSLVWIALQNSDVEPTAAVSLYLARGKVAPNRTCRQGQ
jgi:hypothetical protein